MKSNTGQTIRRLKKENKKLREQLLLHNISQQRELLVAYEKWKGTFLGNNTYNIDTFLEEINKAKKFFEQLKNPTKKVGS